MTTSFCFPRARQRVKKYPLIFQKTLKLLPGSRRLVPGMLYSGVMRY